MKLSFVIPCYNEEKNVAQMHDAVALALMSKNWEYEMIFIDDGSKDKTLKILKQINKDSKENVKIISLSRNFGKESAIYAGLSEAKGDYVTIIDADLQQEPSIAVEMAEMLDDNQDLDCVTACQKNRKEGWFLRSSKNICYKLMNALSSVPMHKGASDFRTMKRNMVDAVLDIQEYYRFSKGIFPWVGFNNEFIDYEVKKRNDGKSKWSFHSLFMYAMEGIFSFSAAPLRIATIIGLISSFVAVAYMIFIVIQKIVFGIVVPGYPTIVVLILLLGGLQLFALGIIGEYMARTYVETKHRPIYITREIIDYELNKE